jgi:hypothetical protein
MAGLLDWIAPQPGNMALAPGQAVPPNAARDPSVIPAIAQAVGRVIAPQPGNVPVVPMAHPTEVAQVLPAQPSANPGNPGVIAPKEMYGPTLQQVGAMQTPGEQAANAYDRAHPSLPQGNLAPADFGMTPAARQQEYLTRSASQNLSPQQQTFKTLADAYLQAFQKTGNTAFLDKAHSLVAPGNNPVNSVLAGLLAQGQPQGGMPGIGAQTFGGN